MRLSGPKMKLVLLLAALFSVAFPALLLAQDDSDDDFPEPPVLKRPQRRSSWYIGFGIGGAIDARYHYGGQDTTFNDFFDPGEKEVPVALNFKVGATLSPNTLLGFDMTGAVETGKIYDLSGASHDADIQIDNYFLMLTHFPFEKGLFFRGGGGFSHLITKVSGKESDASGYGALVGVGYAFWLGKTFNLTLNVDHSRQWYSDTYKPNRSQFTIAYVGFDWY